MERAPLKFNLSALSDSNIQTGKLGEQLACKYLESKGYQIVATNFRSKNFGEIDIVATKGRKTVFFEVKTRSSNWKGTGEEAINLRKLKALSRVCEIFIKAHLEFPQSLRLDAILILLDSTNPQNSTIRHYENLDINGKYWN